MSFHGFIHIIILTGIFCGWEAGLRSAFSTTRDSEGWIAHQ